MYDDEINMRSAIIVIAIWQRLLLAQQSNKEASSTCLFFLVSWNQFGFKFAKKFRTLRMHRWPIQPSIHFLSIWATLIASVSTAPSQTLHEASMNIDPGLECLGYSDSRSEAIANHVSTRDLQKARRAAQRRRLAPACNRCEVAKAKCSESRPCRRCIRIGAEASCDTPLSVPTSSKVFKFFVVFYRK